MLEDLDAVTLVQGEARSTGERTVEVRPAEAADGDDDGERLTIRARHLVVNTGTTPLRPEMPGVDLPGVHDSETLQLQMDRTRAPRRRRRLRPRPRPRPPRSSRHRRSARAA